jgi:hypothetical protein
VPNGPNGQPEQRTRADQQGQPAQQAQQSQQNQPGQQSQPAQQGRSAERTRPNTSPVSGGDRPAAREPESAGRGLPTAVPPNLVPPNEPKAPAPGTTTGHRQPSRDLTPDSNRSPQQPTASPPAGKPSASSDSQAGPSSAQQQSPTPPLAARKPPATPTPASASADPAGGLKPSGSSADEDLSQRERDLLRQLHEELAKREQGGQAPNQDGSAGQGGWQVDKSANRQSPFANPALGGARPETAATGHWQPAPAAGEPTPVNGVPPYGHKS